MKLTGLLIAFYPYLVLAQQTEGEKMSMLINGLSRSDSAEFVFDLTQVATVVTDEILRTYDSAYGLSNTNASLKLKRFMANASEEKWNPTDAIENDRWPRRRFIYAIRSGSKWVLTYEHGGLGYHLHVVFLDTSDFGSLSITNDVLNVDEISALVWDKRTEEIKSRPFKSIIKEDGFQMLRRQRVGDSDLF